LQYIADPSMHSMPTAVLHPSGKFLSFQSLDSQIVTYSATAKLRVNKKKVFTGHLVGGNACQVRLAGSQIDRMLWLARAKSVNGQAARAGAARTGSALAARPHGAKHTPTRQRPPTSSSIALASL
jgi:hypothetical protein